MINFRNLKTGEIKSAFLLMNKYPDKIRLEFSQTKRKMYPMNICGHCGAKQGWYFVFRDVNKLVSEMQRIDIID